MTELGPVAGLPGARGAVMGDGSWAGVPLHYGDPSGEQWALEAGRAIVWRADLAAVTVGGVDRQTWLTSLASQVVTGMVAGDSRELLILDPQGHIEHAAALGDDGERTWLITEADRAPGLAAWLDSMTFALRVEVGERSDVEIFGTLGEASGPGCWAELPGVLVTWDDPWPGVVEGGTEYFQGTHPAADVHPHLAVVERSEAGACVREWLGATQKRQLAGMLSWEAMRIAAWRPRIGTEVDERSIPAELDWLRTAVHTHKGCYRGQESVARVLNLGRPARRLVFLQLDGSIGDLPEAGAPIMRGDKQVGVVTSAARHADMGPIALAIVARNVPGDIVFDLGGVAAAQELIVPIDGKAADSPEERPGAGLSNPALRRGDMRPNASGGLGPAS